MGWIVELSIFGGWMSIVGNPHVVETSIGIVIALVGGFWMFFKIEPEANL